MKLNEIDRVEIIEIVSVGGLGLQFGSHSSNDRNQDLEFK